MNLSDIKYKANYYVLLLLAFVIPLERRLIAPLIILFFVSSIFNGGFNIEKKSKVLFFSGIYFLYLLGLLYTDNISFGLADILTKLSLIILPFSFFLTNIDLKKKLPNILKSFLEGCGVSVLVALAISVYKFYFSFDLSVFFYNNIALFAHSSYLALMMSLALIILYHFLFSKSEIPIITPKITVILLSVFSIFILLLSSKTGLITMIIIHTISLSVWVIKYKALIKGITVFSLFILSFFVAYNYSNLFKERINELTTITQPEDIANSSTSSRKIIWKTAFSLIKNEPFFGYGTGDSKDVLIMEYEKRELFFLADKKLNAHNQFIQTALSIGLLGCLFLVLLLLIPLIMAIKQKHYIYIGFLLLILINFSTEAMLERQVGVVFYAFFNALFFVAYFSNNHIKNKI